MSVKPLSNQSTLNGAARKGSLGTFLGVFTPTILTILGVIMYLRFGWVVGQVGLFKTLLIVVLANVITFLTALSLSAIATNSHVGVGGAYYMISRSLGLEIGGAIGIPLYLSQALSVTLYAFGLAESLKIIWPEVPVSISAFIIIIIVTALAFKGAEFALKVQLPVMVLIALSIVALGAGSFSAQDVVTFNSGVTAINVGFWAVFAVFFPAVTGIMAGLSMSGDLRNPGVSIPRGSVAATLAGFLVYLVVPIFLYVGADTNSLIDNPLIWTKVAMFGPWLILPGLWGAIFSSAVGSMLAAPRTLQALSIDKLVPGVFAGKSDNNDEPRTGMLLTLGLSLAAVFLGDLNTVATVATMFFLSVYGTVNLVSALEHISGNPSWRPTLKVHWTLSLLGGLGCFGVMLLIHWPATVFAMTVEFALWIVLKSRVRKDSWGDVRRDLYEALIRWALVKLNERQMTARNWRPHVLVFVSNVEKRLDLVRFGAWFAENRGVVSVSELLQGDIIDTDLDMKARQDEINKILKGNHIVAFGEVNVVQNLERGILAVAQSNGIAGMESNTILVGWPDDHSRLVNFLRVVKPLKALNRSLIIGKTNPLSVIKEGQKLEIHVWWGGLKRNGDLMLLLAYLLTRNPEWCHARIRIMSIASNELMKGQTERFLAQLIPRIRIDADVEVTLMDEDESVFDIMHRESKSADVVLLGLATPEHGEVESYAERLLELADGFQNCFFVHNGSLFLGDLVTPEQISSS